MTDSNKPESAPNQSIENIIGERVLLFNGRYGRGNSGCGRSCCRR